MQLGRFGITVNCIHPGVTRTERTPRLLAARAKELGIAPEDVEKSDFADDSPRGNAIGRMVDAREIAYLTAFLASDKAWAVTGISLTVRTGVSREGGHTHGFHMPGSVCRGRTGRGLGRDPRRGRGA